MSRSRRRFLALLVVVVCSSAVAPDLQAQESDLLVTKSGPAESAADTDVAYTIELTNLGPDASAAVTLSDAIPGGMTFVSATQESGFAFNCATPSPGDTVGSIDCTQLTMAAGESAVFTFVFHIPPATAPGTTFTNVVTVNTPTDPNEENDVAIAVTTTPFPPQGDMSVMKDGPFGAGPDTDVAYTITLVNAGPDDAQNVTFEDVLPGTTTFVSLTQDDGPMMTCTTPAIGAGGTVSCSIATFPLGTSATFTLVVHIPADTPAGTQISNSATVTSPDDPNEENDISSTVLTVSSSDLQIEKTGDTTGTAGTDITYTLLITNNGPDAASDVTVDDVLPPDTTFVSLTQDNGPIAVCSTPFIGTNGPISCNFGSFAPLSSAQFTLVIEAGNTTSISNTATVTHPGADDDGTNNSSTIVTAITPSADLSVVKSGPATVTAGNTATYSITVTNNGPSDATSVSLIDTLPANATFLTMTQDSGPAFVCAGTCTIDTFAAGATATFTLVVSVDPSAPNGSSFDNTATISAATGDPDGDNNTSTAAATVTTQADVSVTKSGPATANADTDVTYTITVTNAGPSDAANVSLSDPTPANATFVSMAQTSGPSFSCGGSVTCTIASLDPGATATFDLVLHVTPSAPNGSTIANVATVSTTTTDPDDSNDSANATTTVAGVANLSVVKNGPPTANADSDVTYTITVTNNGPSEAANVSLSDTPPANTTFVSMTQTSGPTFSCSGTVTCTIAALASGATATFDLVLHVDPAAPGGSSIANTANVSTTTNDPNTTNNSSTATTTVVAVADLGVTKSGPATINANTNIAYTITVTNAGPSIAANVSLSDTPPINTTFVSMTQTSGPTFTCAGTVTCTIASLAPDATAAFDLVLHVEQTAADGSTILNTAAISTTTNDPNDVNDSSTSTAVVAVIADLAVVKSGPAGAEADSDVTYTIAVTNNGPADAANVALSDPTPANATFVSMTQTSGPTFACAGSVTCTIATLPAGATATFALVLHVSPSAPDNSSIANTASVSTTTNDPSAANNSSTATTLVTAVADLTITKSGPTDVDANTDITYVITVTNEGPSEAASVTLTDVLPAQTTFVSLTQNAGPTFNCTTPPAGGIGTITCTIATLPTDTTSSFSLVLHVIPQAFGTLSNTATVTSPTDFAPANNAGTASAAITPIQIPALSPMMMAVLALALGALAIHAMRT